MDPSPWEMAIELGQLIVAGAAVLATGYHGVRSGYRWWRARRATPPDPGADAR